MIVKILLEVTNCVFIKIISQILYLNHTKTCVLDSLLKVAPINIKKGKYQNVPIAQRLCPLCVHCIEDKIHILTNCDLHIDLREELYSVIS